ncbi:MAG: ArnT family glycosyltransferase [Bacteroidia bacterium]
MKKRSLLIGGFIVIGLFFLYNLDKSFFYKIQGIHSWRQADCLGMTYNYYLNGLNFFDSSFLCINPSTCSGKVVGEFPVLYYLTALLWKIFGQHEIILRAIDFGLLLLGFYYLYKLSKKIVGDTFLKSAPVLLLAGSPVLIYYSNNYLPDVPALGLVLAGFYYFYEHTLYPDNKKLWKASIFWLIAMLLKVTYGILPLSSIAVFLMKSIKEKKFIANIKQSLPFFVSLFLVACWYLYANSYNEKNQSHHFLLTGLMPIWKVDPQVIHEVTRLIFTTRTNQLYPNFINLFFIASFFFFLVNRKRVNGMLLSITSLTFTGTIVYFLFWYKQFEAHDYYLINFLPFFACVFLLFLDYYKSVPPSLFRKALTVIPVVLIVLNIYYTAVNIRLRAYHYDDILKYSLSDKNEIELYKYMDKLYVEFIRPFETCKPYLGKLGVRPGDKAIILPDYTYNMTLYLTGLRGFTACGSAGIDGYTYNFNADVLRYQIKCGVKYLIIYDNRILLNEGLKEFTKHPIGKYQNIVVYKL